jgi:hypothetical protein
MHELTKAEQFNLVEDAVKTGVAPAGIAAAFNEMADYAKKKSSG